MSRRELDTHVRLDRMSEEQIETVHENVVGELIGKAGDLRLLHRHRDPERAIMEVAALGHLAFWLGHGQVVVPDPVAREVVRGLADGIDALNEWDGVARHHEQAKAEHDALHALLACFEEVGGDA